MVTAREMIGVVQQRGAAIIAARGLSSAASAASAAIEHVRDWIGGTPAGTWASMGVVSGGEYGVEEGLVYSYPCTCAAGRWSVVPRPALRRLRRGNDEGDRSRAARGKRAAVAALLG